MAGVTHTFVSGVADGADTTLVRPSNWNAAHTIAWSTASLDFTNGDTLKRFTVSDAAAGTSSHILAMIERPNTATDSADRGYIYQVNVVNRAAGSFDVLVNVLGWGFDDPDLNPPDETVTLVYALG